MTTILRRAALAAVAFVGTVSAASAQPAVPSGGISSPPLSPYLNLIRNNTNNANPAFNYLTLTRPQMQFAQQANQMSQQLQATNLQLQQQAATQNNVVILGGDPSLPYSGHSVSFGNLGGRFGNLGGGAGGSRVGGPLTAGGTGLPGAGLNLNRGPSLGSTFGGGIGARGVGGIGVAGMRR